MSRLLLSLALTAANACVTAPSGRGSGSQASSDQGDQAPSAEALQVQGPAPNDRLVDEPCTPEARLARPRAIEPQVELGVARPNGDQALTAGIAPYGGNRCN